MRKLVISVCAALLAAGAAVVGAPAQAATISVAPPYQLVTNCPGGMVSGFPKQVQNSVGERLGRVELFYSSANGGTNCTKFYDQLSGSYNMSAQLRLEGISHWGVDAGTFSTYAGGVLVTGTAGKCVWVKATLSLGVGGLNQYAGSWGPVACGSD